MTRVILTILQLLFCTQLFCQFELCNSNTTNNLNDVFFLNETIGVAVGDSGTIIRSSDGGLNWDLILNIDTIQFKKVKFWDESNGIAIGTSIYLSNDGGLSWYKKEYENNNFKDIEIIGVDNAIITGGEYKVMKISDYGHTFEVIDNSNSQISISHISFIDEYVGFGIMQEASSSKLFKTHDGGYNWIEIEQLSGDLFTLTEDLVFVTEETGFKGGWYNPQLVKSTDGGINWSQTTLEDNEWIYWSSIYDFHIDRYNPNVYFSCGWYGEIFKSYDQGNNWIQLYSPVNSATSLKSIYFLTENIGWSVGENGTVIKTLNGGLSSLPDIRSRNVGSISPNPFSKDVYLKNCDLSKITEIAIYNTNGHLIKNLAPACSYDLYFLPKGIYYFEMKTKNESLFEKIIKN